ncbi:MAG: hypothetical protein ABIL58_20255 [Pseudomonadota bacterium]
MMRRFLITLCFIVAAGCGRGDGGEAYKARLVGIWVSNHPSYEGCEMTIARDRMVFQADDGTIKTTAISDIDYTKDGRGHLLQLHMTEGGEPAYTMSFYLETGSDGDHLRFKNQPQVVWGHAPMK